MPRRTRKLISRLVTNVSGPYYGHGRAIDPENPGDGPGDVSGWEDCDPEDGQNAIVDPTDPHYYQPVPGSDGQGSVDGSEDDCHVCVYHLDEYSPGRRVARKSAGAQLLFGTYGQDPALWNLRATPELSESVDRIITATSEYPESWVVDISAKETLGREATGVVTAQTQGQVNQDGNFFSVLKARIRYGAAGIHYVDVDIGNSTRVAVEGEIVQVSILTPKDGAYRVSNPDSTITVPVGETAVISNTYVTASAYVTETAPESVATYTQVIAIAAGDAFPLTRIDIPPRAYAVSVYSNVALANNIAFDSALAFGGTFGSEIVLDAATLRADDIVIPQNSHQILLPFIAAAPANTQITIVYSIR